jgi:hypothetical protein
MQSQKVRTGAVRCGRMSRRGANIVSAVPIFFDLEPISTSCGKKLLRSLPVRRYAKKQALTTYRYLYSNTTSIWINTL